MHKDCLDAAIYVYDSSSHDDTNVELLVSWINLGYSGQPWTIPYPNKNKLISRLTLKQENLGHWINIDDKINHVRTKPGLP